MKSCWILFLSLVCLGSSGCCSTYQRRLSALEKENSQLNGLLWEMQFQLEDLEEKNQILSDRAATTEDEGEAEPRRIAPSRRAPDRDREEAEPFDPDKFTPPVIQFPDSPSPEGEIPERLLPDSPGGAVPPLPGQTRNRRRSATPVSATRHEEPALPEPKLEVVPPSEVSLNSSGIRRIALAPVIGALHLDDKPGEDGLVIVVEPWNDARKMLAVAADLNVVLIDPAEPAATSRYAQWKFEAREVAKLFRAGDVPGLHLELPWPGDPPRHDRLHLFVRYTTSDGRKLEADCQVKVELGGRGRWVATETPRLRPYEEPVALPQPVAVPELLAIDTAPAKPIVQRRKAPVQTVSIAREASEPARLPERPASEPAARPREVIPTVESHRAVRPLPKREPDPEPEPPARQRPSWSPDRPW